MDIYRQLPPSVMASLAARELAGKLSKIEHLNVSHELLGRCCCSWCRRARRVSPSPSR